MRMLRDKSKVSTIALVLLLMAPVMLMATPVQPVKAQYTNMQEGGSVPLPPGVTPDVTVTTFAGLSFRPNPVGVGQPFLVNIWIIPSTHASQYLSGFKVTITKPDGTKDVITMKSYIGDATAWFEYVADQVGTWKLKFEFPGGYFPPGNYTAPAEAFIGYQVVSFTQSVYYEPASTPEQELVVQQEQVLSWPPSPLPTDYWTQPVSSENREWWSILGDYPWRGPASGGPGWEALWDKLYPNTNKYWSSVYRFTPWVQAPNSAHIVWKRQNTLGGLIGGDIGQESVPLGFQVSTRVTFPSIVYAGRCYETFVTAVDGKMAGVWRCYDLRTGEVYWEHPTPTTVTVSGVGGMSYSTGAPTVIEYFVAGGEHPGATAWPGTSSAMSLVYIGGGRLIKYDPWNGAVTWNFSIAPLTTGTYYRNGYALTVQNIGTTAAPNYRLINWTTFGRTANFTERVMNNITWPWSSLPATTDYNVGIAALISDITPPGTGVITQNLIGAASLATGALLWNMTVDGDTMGGTELADHGKLAFILRGTRQCSAFDLYSGKLAWKSELISYPWGQFMSYTSSSSAYGLLYETGFEGLYAFDWDTGKIVWKYKAPAPYPYESPYVDETGQTVYCFWGSVLIADGKVYAYNMEHTYTQPITRGWKLHCINATTGKGIWNITGPQPGAIADGYLVACSYYDVDTYVFGKGQSATTVSAPQTTIAKGTPVLITGTVLDQSPAQPDTPCISKESMATYMEYLHMQKPIPAGYTVTGVPVMLLAFDANGTVTDIGTVTSDVSGSFQYAWTPPKEGVYKITATFAGDDSYGSSWAETAISVGPAPEAPPPQEEAAAPAYTAIDLAIIAAIVVVAILVVYTLYTVRKQRK